LHLFVFNVAAAKPKAHLEKRSKIIVTAVKETKRKTNIRNTTRTRKTTRTRNRRKIRRIKRIDLLLHLQALPLID